MINFPIRIDNGNVIKNKPIKTKILNSFPKLVTKNFRSSNNYYRYKKGMIKIN